MTIKCSHVLSDDVSQYFAESAYITNDVIDALYAMCASDEDRQKLKTFWFIRNPYEETAGLLTFAERKINLVNIERTFNQMDESFLAEVKKVTNQKKEEYLKMMERSIIDKDFEAIGSIRPDMGGDVAKLYAENMKTIFEVGKKTASDELGVTSPETSKDVRWLYRAQSQQMEDKIWNEMAITAQSEALYNIARGAVASYTLDMVQKAVDTKLSKIVVASGTQAMGGAFNTGRLAVFEKHRDMIYGFQYTAVIDRRTTNLCMSLNGRVIGPNDSDFYRLAPPNHTGCRSFWVEILKDEFIKPAIEWIPDSIPRNRTGLTNFQDLQKIIPYKPKSAATPDEQRLQREGVLRQLVKDLQEKGVKMKTTAEVIAPAVEKLSPYIPAKSFDELDERAKQFFKNIDWNFRHFKDLDVANAVMEAIHNVHQKVPSLEIKALELKNVKLKGAAATMSHNMAFDNLTLRFNQKWLISMGTDRKKLSEVNAEYIADIEKKIEFYKNDTGNQLSSYYIKSYEAQIEKLKKQSDIWTMSSLDSTLADWVKSITYHELGHAVDNVISWASMRVANSKPIVWDIELWKFSRDSHSLMKEFREKAKKDPSILSEYGKTNIQEVFAESHAAYWMDHHERLTPEIKKFFDDLYDHFSK
mgnify:CR=1 FL=1